MHEKDKHKYKQVFTIKTLIEEKTKIKKLTKQNRKYILEAHSDTCFSQNILCKNKPSMDVARIMNQVYYQLIVISFCIE